MENSLVFPQKAKHRITIWCSNSSKYIAKENEKRDSNSYLYTDVHSSIIHNGQKV